jgi:hypothetical protein
VCGNRRFLPARAQKARWQTSKISHCRQSCWLSRFQPPDVANFSAKARVTAHGPHIPVTSIEEPGFVPGMAALPPDLKNRIEIKLKPSCAARGIDQYINDALPLQVE